MVAERTVTATAATDHTVRVMVYDLKPDRFYYYRFQAGRDVSPISGRSRTAPDPANPRAVKFAWASCQGYDFG